MKSYLPLGLKEFIALYGKYHQDVKKGDFVEVINHYTNIICKKINADAIKSLSALFDIGYTLIAFAPVHML